MRFVFFLLVFFSVFTNAFAQEWIVNQYSKKNILPSNFVYDIEQDEKGGILFGLDNGLYRFNGLEIQNLIVDVFVEHISVWQNEIWILDKENVIRSFNNLELSRELNLGLQDDVLEIEFFDGELYVLMSDRLEIYDVEDVVSFKTKISVSNPVGLKKSKKTIFLVSEEGVYNLLNNTFLFEGKVEDVSIYKDISILSDGELIRLNFKGETLSKTKVSSGKIINLGGVGDVIVEEDRVFLLRDNSSEYIVNSEFYEHRFTVVFRDFYGGLWFAEKGSGVYNISNPEIIRYDTDGDVNCITSFNNKIVFGTSSGLAFYNQNKALEKLILNELNVRDIVADKNVLYLSSNQGVYKIDAAFRVSKLSNDDALKIELINNFLYVSTTNDGLMIFDLDSSTKRYLNISDGLSHNIITDMCAVKDTLVLSTPAGRLDKVWKNNVLQNNTYAFNAMVVTNSLFYNKAENVLYCATPNTGLYKFNSPFKYDVLAFNHLVYSIFKVDSNVWVTHDEGMSIVRSENKISQVFEPNDPSGFLPFASGMNVVKDDLFLGVNGGYFQIKLHKEYHSENVPFSVQRITVDDKVVALDSLISLDYGRYRIEVGLDFVKLYGTELSNLEWRMSNYQTDWHDLLQGKLVFPSLRAGSYDLELRLKGEVDSVQKISFEISSPFWENLWFWLCLIPILLFLAYLIFQWRVRSLKMDKLKLEKKVVERTRVVQEKNEELKQFAYVVSHDFKNPVVNIQALSEMIMNPDVPKEQLLEIAEHINKSSSSLYAQLIGMIDLLKVGSENLKIESVNISDILKEIEENISELIIAENAVLAYPKNQILVNSNYQYLYSILYNLITNAIKYRHPDRKPVVKVEVKQDYSEFSISVSDNGLGLDLEQIEKQLFQPFVRIHTQNEGSGLGLALVQRMVTSLNGQITVDSTGGRGSKFLVTFK